MEVQKESTNLESESMEQAAWEPETRAFLYQYSPDGPVEKQLGVAKTGDTVELEASGRDQHQFGTGDRIVLWRTGDRNGFTAVVEVRDPFVSKSDYYWLPLTLIQVLEKTIPAEAALRIPPLGDASPFRVEMPGNIFPLEHQITDAIDQLFKEQGYEPPFQSPTPTPTSTQNQQLHIHHDAPAVEDLLSREPLARALARRLNRLWYGANRAHAAEHLDDSPLVIHLSAPWGGGKSTFMNFLTNNLCRTPDEEDSWQPVDTRPWIAVVFNAWQHQHVDPPWWTLADSIFDQISDDMREHRQGSWAHPIKWLRHRCRRLRFWFVKTYEVSALVYGLRVLGVVTVVTLLLWSIWISDLFGDQQQFSKFISTAISALIGFIGLGFTIAASLFPRSATRARQRTERQGDPMGSLKSHLKRVIDTADCPVIVFIDDLDRCYPVYTVKLLEGIQTLFRSSRLVFLVAGDRRWINVCFEQVYETFDEKIYEPGKSLGTLFLDKCFQLSFHLPDPSDEEIEAYWHQLIDIRTDDVGEAPDDEREAIEAEFKGKDEEDLRNELTRLDANDPHTRLRRGEMIVRLADYEIAEEREQHLLAQFRHLLEPNPRMMKRFVNFYGIAEAIALLRGIPVGTDQERSQLALWLILEMRWPRLAEALQAEPGLVGASAAGTAGDEISSLFADSAVQSVIDGELVGARLDVDSVRRLGVL